MTRQSKTPRQRAEEQLATAERAVTRLTRKYEHDSGALTLLHAELRDAERRRDYLAKNPDLPQQPDTDTNPTGAHTA